MTSDAEFRMLMMLNTMDLNQEGHLSSEDRLFMAPTNQQQQSQINPFGGVRWEGGKPVYCPSTYQAQQTDNPLFSPQHEQCSPDLQQMQLQQQQQLQMQQQMQLQQQQQQLLYQQQQQQMLLQQQLAAQQGQQQQQHQERME